MTPSPSPTTSGPSFTSVATEEWNFAPNPEGVTKEDPSPQPPPDVCLPEEQPALFYTDLLGTPNHSALWRPQGLIPDPNVQGPDFAMPRESQYLFSETWLKNNQDLVGHHFPKSWGVTPPYWKESPQLKESSPPSPSSHRVQTTLEVQTRQLLDLDLPGLPFDVEIDLGTLHIPVTVEDGAYLINPNGLIVSDVGLISFGVDTSSFPDWYQAVFAEHIPRIYIPLKAVVLDDGYPVLIFDSANAHHLDILGLPDWLDRARNQLMQKATQKLLDAIGGEPGSLCYIRLDENLTWPYRILYQFVPATLLDENGRIKTRFTPEDAQKTADRVAEKTGMSGKRKVTLNAPLQAALNADHLQAQLIFRPFGEEAPPAVIKVQDASLHTEAATNLKFQPTTYAILGKVPTHLTLQPPSSEEPTQISGELNFRFRPDTQEFMATFNIASVQSNDLADAGNFSFVARLPQWHPQSLDPQLLLEEASLAAFAEFTKAGHEFSQTLLQFQKIKGANEFVGTADAMYDSDPNKLVVQNLPVAIAYTTAEPEYEITKEECFALTQECSPEEQPLVTVGVGGQTPIVTSAQTTQGSFTGELHHFGLGVFDQAVTYGASLGPWDFNRADMGLGAQTLQTSGAVYSLSGKESQDPLVQRFQVQGAAQAKALYGFGPSTTGSMTDFTISSYTYGANRVAAQTRMNRARVNLATEDGSYALHFTGTARLQKSLAENGALIDHLSFSGRFDAYDTSSPTQVILALINHGTLTTHVDALELDSTLNLPKQVKATVSVDLSGVTIEDEHLKELPEKIQAQIRHALQDGKLNLNVLFDWQLQKFDVSILDQKFAKSVAPFPLEDFLTPAPPPVNLSGVKTVYDLIPAVAEAFVVGPVDGLITTTKPVLKNPDDYNRTYYEAWQDKKGMGLDWHRNKWVRTQQKRMRRHEEGMPIFNGSRGVLDLGLWWLDLRVKKNTRADFRVIHNKNLPDSTPDNGFGNIKAIDILLSKPMRARLFRFLPIACVNGLYVDMEKGMITADLSPLPDGALKKPLTNIIWKGTPEELKTILIECGYNARYPTDLGVWFQVLQRLDFFSLTKNIKEAGTIKPKQKGIHLPLPKALKPNVLNDQAFIEAEDIAPLHIDTKLNPDRVVDFKIAKVHFERLEDGSTPVDDPNRHRIIADVDYNNKTIVFHFPSVERLVIEIGQQKLILERGHARGLKLQMIDENHYTFTAEEMGIQAIQFLDETGKSPSYSLVSSEPTTFTNLVGSAFKDENGTWNLGVDNMDFTLANQMDVRITDQNSEFSVKLEDDNQVKGHFYSHLQVLKEGTKPTQTVLKDWGLDIEAPQVAITMGIAPKEQGALAQKTQNPSPPPFSGFFELHDGKAHIGVNSGEQKPQAWFSGKVHVLMESPTKITESSMPGINLNLSSSLIDVNFDGVLNFDGYTLSAIPNKTLIDLNIKGSGQMQFDSQRFAAASGLEAAVENSPQVYVDANVTAAIHGTVSGLQLVFAPKAAPRFTVLNLEELGLDFLSGSASTMVYQGNHLFAENVLADLKDSQVRISRAYSQWGDEKNVDLQGKVHVDLHDASTPDSQNRILLDADFSNPESLPTTSIKLQGPQKKYALQAKVE